MVQLDSRWIWTFDVDLQAELVRCDYRNDVSGEMTAALSRTEGLQALQGGATS
jgi:hypothetical protein